jgi:periplasmic divalent cation tolerance protein
LVRRIKTLHPYEVPCIAVLPITGGHGPFLEWIAANSRV